MPKEKKPIPYYVLEDLETTDQVDILIISEPLNYRFGQLFKDYHCEHIFMHTHESIDKVPNNIDVIAKLKPKLVMYVGYLPFKEVEKALGHDTGISDFIMLPTSYQGHNFWQFPMPDYEAKKNTIKYRNQIVQAMNTPPKVYEGNHEGVEFVIDNDKIDEAFAYLKQQPYVAFDIETNDFKPYYKHSKLLSVALSDGVRTFAFPLFHSQTPESFDAVKVLTHLLDFPNTKLIAHNLIFELQWLASYLSEEFLYSNEFQDTQSQIYLLTKFLRKSLDSCVRRTFGFSLKILSDLDVAALDSYPLEEVLKYNALDAKYTALLFHEQEKLIDDADLQRAYQMQIERIPGITLMQMRGLVPNPEFLKEEMEAQEFHINDLTNTFNGFQEVKNQLQKYGTCNPNSDKDVPRLFKEELGIPDYQDTFGKKFLATLDKPVAGILIELRSRLHIVSTNLVPFRKDIPDGGKYIYDDGLIHANFNTMKTLTGRLSSDSPNEQNLPSKDGKKYLRNIIKAPPGHKIAAFDYGQIEARLIASFSNDKILIDEIKNNFDTHMYWAKRVLSYSPSLVDDPNDPKQMKEFRGLMKNQFVFPTFYGAWKKTVWDAMEIPEDIRKELDPIFDEFWTKYKTVKGWQAKIKAEYSALGYVGSPFGRKYWAPLKKTEIINYPVQGAASDIVVNASTRLSKMSVKEGIPDLAPRINIHDDLTFYIREELLDEIIPVILKVLLTPYDWLLVPLSVEVAIGDTLGALKEFGTFSSSDLVLV